MQTKCDQEFSKLKLERCNTWVRFTHSRFEPFQVI